MKALQHGRISSGRGVGAPTSAARCSVPLQWQRPTGISYQSSFAQLTQPQPSHAFQAERGYLWPSGNATRHSHGGF